MTSGRHQKKGYPDAAEAGRRLQHLYEISKLFASFASVEQTFDPALAIATRTLPLRSAILIQAEEGRSKMIVWRSDDQTSDQMRTVKEHAAAAYAYLVETASAGSHDRNERAGMSSLSLRAGIDGDSAKRLIVIPLLVAHRPPFGVLQLEGAQPLGRKDLMFVNAIANQLAIALDRDRAWRRDITRRQRAEEGRTDAETRGAAAERGRLIAESSREEFEKLAHENARLYEQARQAVRVREQVLAIVSHDLKNPLGAILIAAGALAKRGAREEGLEGRPQAVGTILRASERMLRLIDDLLDFANIEVGRLAITRQAEDPVSMIQETLASFESVAREQRLVVTAHVQPDLPQASCDRDRILQVLSNLVGNATKATPEGGHITLTVEPRGRDLLFTVSDDGPGISREDMKHLFERYWRGGEATYKGTGLGLAIAKGIVAAHGGRIWAESKAGYGARFLFTVPAADTADLRPGEEASPSHQHH